jgi:hypothetical protein
MYHLHPSFNHGNEREETLKTRSEHQGKTFARSSFVWTLGSFPCFCWGGYERKLFEIRTLSKYEVYFIFVDLLDCINSYMCV